MKTGIFAFVMLLMAASCTQKNVYTLKGKFNGTPDEEWIYMIRLFDDISTMDSAKIVDGAFVFKGKVDRPELYALHFHPERLVGVATVFLEPGEIVLEIDLENWDLNSIASGTPLNDNFNKVENERIELFWREIWSLEEMKFQAEPDEIDPINQKIAALQEASLKHDMDYILEHMDSPVALFLFSRIQFNLSPNTMHQILQRIDPSLQQTMMYQTMLNEYDNLKLTGEDDGFSEWPEPLGLQ